MAQRFTQEFEGEPVRLVRTSGQTRREIANDLGVGLSTLTRWASRSRDLEIDDPKRRQPCEDAAAELKRLRRENEILRQERDILKRAKVFFAKAGRLHRNLALAAPRRAFAIRRPDPGLICHSDRGSQYCSIDYQSELKKHGALISMSGRGHCYGNAIIETFLASPPRQPDST
ncbi:DDE-type integrase/transposase/recombinase [Acidisoma cellulosilytica]|uniref:DDE-type integrase/transposase/recombinase n=1 Tax=Acidisoma cellulosilyticum TaxID=2802395 RepID=A0A963Z4M3_9PROT|nr:DDE-type integrase/transposase/recombinase [Acidisoma cellulosilyticum]